MGGTYTCGGVLASTNYAFIFEFSPGLELHCKGSHPDLYSNDNYTIFGAMVVHLGIHSTLIHAHASLLMLISFLLQLCWSVFCKTGYNTLQPNVVDTNSYMDFLQRILPSPLHTSNLLFWIFINNLPHAVGPSKSHYAKITQSQS